MSKSHKVRDREGIASLLTLLPGAATDIPDDAASDTALRHVVSKLPPANRDTLAFLMLHLLR